MNLPFGNGSLLKKKTFWVFGMSVRGCSPDFHNGASNGVLCLIRITARCPVVSPLRHSSDAPVAAAGPLRNGSNGNGSKY